MNITCLRKIISFFCYCSKCKNEDEKIFKEEESISDIKKVLSVNENI